MNGDDSPHTGALFHSSPQRLIIHTGKILDAAVRHECFEADHSAFIKFLQPTQIAGHQAAPESEISYRTGLRRGDLLVETGAIRGRRMRVQWHIEEHCPSPRSQCA